MKPRSKPATKEEKARYEKLKRLPCIACYKLGEEGCGKHTIQHMTSGGRRLGNEWTYSLGAWHHQAHILPGFSGKEMRERFGPSFAESKQEFERVFGTEEDLLLETNRLLNEQTGG